MLTISDFVFMLKSIGSSLKIRISYFVLLNDSMQLSFPNYEPRFRQKETAKEIWDPFRKKWVAFTPEEWVRQNMLHFLVHRCQVPPALVAIEKSLKIGPLTKRADILVYKEDAVWMLVECKAQNIGLDQDTLQQILAYHTVRQAKYLVISNGTQTFCFSTLDGQWQAQEEMPVYA
ncbi:MAG: type I restriction enzyme HsdR N-terminal domain-containing protein [Sphingobacteriia bacterium]|nr:MAG: type I restriction enzyme HsdR N-terminal domain-containing protein [Sphingobacteriia bacterium]